MMLLPSNSGIAMPDFDGKSIIELMDAAENDGLDYSMYVGYTKRMIKVEALEFMGRRGANRPKNQDGTTPLNRPVLLRGDKTLHEKKRHFTAKQCEDELQMKYTMVYCSKLKLNAFQRYFCILVCIASSTMWKLWKLWPGPTVAACGHGPRREGQAAEKGRGTQGLRVI
jgi:hypothetical protein